MDVKLADRVRAIVTTGGLVPPPRSPSPVASADALERILGGRWRHEPRGSCFVVERRLEAATRHGSQTIGDLASRLRAAAPEAPLLAAGAPAGPPFVFFDLETTGLSGGAGTYAFLIGCAWFDDEDGFVTRQYVLARIGDERSLLLAVDHELERAGGLISFNGKSFDAPVLETRYLFHRLDWMSARRPHLDVLHLARRFWGRGAGAPSGGEREDASCSLQALEREVLGAHREGDVPGCEIPDRYFRFLRGGDPGLLAPVLQHNHLDLLSLAGLTARLLHLAQAGPQGAADAREALGLGRMYARAGLDTRARAAYAHAITMARCGAAPALTGTSMFYGAGPHSSERGGPTPARPRAGVPVEIDALRLLALAFRRARQFDNAAECWRTLLDVQGCPRHIVREAAEALAIHLEHRVRDLTAARRFALLCLECGARSAHGEWIRGDAAQYRLARIERKLDNEAGSVRLELD